MFTGLVETVGTVRAVQQAQGAAACRLELAATLDAAAPLVLGESIAVNGCCLTVAAVTAAGPCFDVTTETLARTTLGGLRPTMGVNLERSLPVGGRLGGHVVAGHVDAVGEVVALEMRDSALYVCTRVPQELAPLLAPRGSVCLQGVSLTVTGVDADSFWVSLIPHTRHATTLNTLCQGDRLNVEADLLARYVARLLAVRDAGGAGAAA